MLTCIKLVRDSIEEDNYVQYCVHFVLERNYYVQTSIIVLDAR